MLNTSVVRFNDNFDLNLKGSRDTTNKGIEKWPLSTT